MSETSKAESAAGAADPSAFDFNSYISGISSFPEFKHTVFLNQRDGSTLHQLTAEYDELAERGREILRIQSRIADNPTRSFVDEEAEELAEELGKIEERTAALAPQINDLEKKVRQNALVLVFQAGTAQKLGSVVRQAEKEFHKKHGRKDDSDIEYITAKSKAILAAQLNAYCTKIILHDGTEQDPPNPEGFLVLLDRLIASESFRLMNTLNKSLDSTADWADKIDAGFPGRRHEQAPQPVAGAGAEDVPFLVGTAHDAADRGGEHLGG